MPGCGRWETLVGVMGALGLVAIVAWAQTAAPPAKAKLERLKIAVAPLGWDTNFSWLQSRSGNLDKRPALEFLSGWKALDYHVTQGYQIPRELGRVYRQGRAPLGLPHHPA
jgi:hypothetical protein